MKCDAYRKVSSELRRLLEAFPTTYEGALPWIWKVEVDLVIGREHCTTTRYNPWEAVHLPLSFVVPPMTIIGADQHWRVGVVGGGRGFSSRGRGSAFLVWSGTISFALPLSLPVDRGHCAVCDHRK